MDSRSLAVSVLSELLFRELAYRWTYAKTGDARERALRFELSQARTKAYYRAARELGIAGEVMDQYMQKVSQWLRARVPA